MHGRPTTKIRPGLELLEERLALSMGTATAHLAVEKAGVRPPAAHPAGATTRQLAPPIPDTALPTRPFFGYLVYRITNPNRFNDHFTPPFGHVLVQLAQPVPGRVYNILYVTVRNGTVKTFNAGSGFSVKFPGQPYSFPILTGDQQWKPGQNYTFYVLTKKYYPLPNPVTSGFVFNLGGAISVAIPGPSGIFLGMKYNPSTIDRNLDYIVSRGAGAQGGVGVTFGLPDTAIYEFVSSKTNRNDFGGYF